MCSIFRARSCPFGIAQIGKAFRNEINPRNYTFRSREFEQMELEYFCRPEQGMELLAYWLKERIKFYEEIGISRETTARSDRAGNRAGILFQRHLRHRIRISVWAAGAGGGRVSHRLRFAAASSRPAASLSIISMRKPRSASSLTWSSQARESIARCWR